MSKELFASPAVRIASLALLYPATAAGLAIGFFPISFWFACLADVLLARARVGRWASTNPELEQAVAPGGWQEYFGFFAPELLLVATTFFLLRRHAPRRWWPVIVLAVAPLSWGVGLAWIQSEPWRVVALAFD